jgi:hypothetical protein
MSKSFLYLPISRKTPIVLERIVQVIFMPVNVIDQQIFGAPWPGGLLTDTELGSVRSSRKIELNSWEFASYESQRQRREKVSAKTPSASQVGTRTCIGT